MRPTPQAGAFLRLVLGQRCGFKDQVAFWSATLVTWEREGCLGLPNRASAASLYLQPYWEVRLRAPPLVLQSHHTFSPACAGRSAVRIAPHSERFFCNMQRKTLCRGVAAKEPRCKIIHVSTAFRKRVHPVLSMAESMVSRETWVAQAPDGDRLQVWYELLHRVAFHGEAAYGLGNRSALERACAAAATASPTGAIPRASGPAQSLLRRVASWLFGRRPRDAMG